MGLTRHWGILSLLRTVGLALAGWEGANKQQLLPDFKNNVFCHHIAHDNVQNMTSRWQMHSLLKYSIYISGVVSCTFHPAFENGSISLAIFLAHNCWRIISKVFEVFGFFNRLYLFVLFVHRMETLERQMPLLLLLTKKFWCSTLFRFDLW